MRQGSTKMTIGFGRRRVRAGGGLGVSFYDAIIFPGAVFSRFTISLFSADT